jgi:hypothetical protein
VGLTRSFNFEDARGRVDGETVALGIVFAGHPVVEGILIFAVEIAIELQHPGGELRGPLRLGIKHERWAPGSAMPTNRLWRPPGRQQMAVSSTAPPRRTRSAELGRTAAPAVAPRRWCGDAGASAAAPTVSQRSQRRCPFPLLWHWFREALSAHRVEAQATQEESTKTRCRRCRSFCVLASPAAPPGPAVRGHRLLRPRQHTETAQKAHPGNKSNGSAETSSKNKKTERVYGDPLPPLPRSCVLAAGPVAQVDPTALAASENSENGAYVYYVLPEAFQREFARGFDAATVAKALRELGHLGVENGRLIYQKRLTGLGRQRVYPIRPSIFAE